MTTYLPGQNPVFRALDADGKPLVGGKVYTYESGTDTPLDVYEDDTGDNPYNQPVVLDSNGEAVIYFGPDSYRINVTDADDVQLDNYPIDGFIPAPAIVDELKAFFADDAGSSFVGFIQSGAGAVARTVQDKSRDIVSVRDFGAIGDGETDDTNAIQVACDALGALPFGGTLYWPNGQYVTTDTINVPAGVSWRAESPGWYESPSSTFGVLIYKKHTRDTVTISENQGGMGMYFDGVGIFGRGLVDEGGRGYVVGGVPCVNIINTNIFQIWDDAFVIGNGTGTCYTCVLDKCYVNNTSKSGSVAFRVNGNSITGTWFTGKNLVSDGCFYGLVISASASQVAIYDCHFEGWRAEGVAVSGSGVNFHGRTYINSTYSGIENPVAMHIYGTANRVEINGIDCSFGDFTGTPEGVKINAGANNVTIKKGTFNGVDVGVGIRDDGYGNTLIDNCVFNGCLYGVIANASDGPINITNNNFYASVTRDIYHNRGSKGLWMGNSFSKGAESIETVASGCFAGYYGGVCVKNNTGFVTRNSGYISSIAPTNTINHGLSATPVFAATGSSMISVQPAGGGMTSPIQVYSLSSAQFAVSWTGTSPNSVIWEARLACDY